MRNFIPHFYTYTYRDYSQSMGVKGTQRNTVISSVISYMQFCRTSATANHYSKINNRTSTDSWTIHWSQLVNYLEDLERVIETLSLAADIITVAHGEILCILWIPYMQSALWSNGMSVTGIYHGNISIYRVYAPNYIHIIDRPIEIPLCVFPSMCWINLKGHQHIYRWLSAVVQYFQC